MPKVPSLSTTSLAIRFLRNAGPVQEYCFFTVTDWVLLAKLLISPAPPCRSIRILPGGPQKATPNSLTIKGLLEVARTPTPDWCNWVREPLILCWHDSPHPTRRFPILIARLT